MSTIRGAGFSSLIMSTGAYIHVYVRASLSSFFVFFYCVQCSVMRMCLCSNVLSVIAKEFFIVNINVMPFSRLATKKKMDRLSW